ncbi:deoxyribose-phosphate aldolase [Candidatus Methylacidiphilum infernorum]|uniref:Deoxyribose-phosphate aldolase n=1 Tax=Methylacidiphilum infernorum (isolate V4) TaxID=481448 RepID=B3DXV0_METI4|nr:deoxyribose-phosphate aldolase [Candidatus Methylacidiphilum infernorum]ACD83902.1 Deoxyribose-phosphate aldolase [Methylacidiphilum infernorum V4]
MAELSAFIDSTLLRPTATKEDIVKLCEEAKQHGLYSVCIQPCWVAQATKLVQKSSLKITTVVGFPLGANKTTVKTLEAFEAIKDGADELDVVVPLWAVSTNQWAVIEEELKAICEVANGKVVKAIIETGYFSRIQIEKASYAAIQGGAKFIKTSTGYGPRGVNIEDIHFLKSLLPPWIGIKASGGIRSKQFALDLIEAGATRIGTSHALALLQE